MVKRGDEGDFNSKERSQFVIDENGKIHTYHWVKLKELLDLPVYPEFLSKHIKSLPSEIQHIIEIK